MAEEVRRVKYIIAREKYAKKVCEYLGLPKEVCYKVFDYLYKRMREAFKTLAEAVGG